MSSVASSNDNGLSVNDINFLVSPMCYGKPHVECQRAKIPIIFVRENKTAVDFFHESVVTDKDIIAHNYVEAAGIISCYKSGVTINSVRRPFIIA